MTGEIALCTVDNAPKPPACAGHTDRPTRARIGRPLKAVNPRVVEKLAALGATTAEIGSVVGCSPDTLERRFAAVLKKGSDAGKTRLRKLQWKAAEAGNPALLIWLGKQLLGQRDHWEHSGPGGGSIPITFHVDAGPVKQGEALPDLRDKP